MICWCGCTQSILAPRGWWRLSDTVMASDEKMEKMARTGLSARDVARLGGRIDSAIW